VTQAFYDYERHLGSFFIAKASADERARIAALLAMDDLWPLLEEGEQARIEELVEELKAGTLQATKLLADAFRATVPRTTSQIDIQPIKATIAIETAADLDIIRLPLINLAWTPRTQISGGEIFDDIALVDLDSIIEAPASAIEYSQVA
jgi:hypothetical protein